MTGSNFKKAALLFILCAVYFLAGKLGLELAYLHPSASPVWPPTGIALTALLLLGYWVWPAIFVGAFLVNITTVGTVATSLGIALGNTLEGLCGAYLINTYAGGKHVFDHPRTILKFAILAGLISTMVSATIGVTSLALGSYAAWSSFGEIWLTWWLGDIAGNLVVAPFLILWSLPAREQLSRIRILEFSLLLLILAAVGQLVFGGWLIADSSAYPLSFLPLPILVWIAFRFGLREAVTSTFILSLIAIAGTLRGEGAFNIGNANQSLLFLQAFMAVISVKNAALASVISKERSNKALLLQINKALISENIERTKAEKQLKAALQEREVLLREVHHRVKNNLQVVCSLFDLQSNGIKDQSIINIFRESKNRVYSMAFVHHELYRSTDLGKIDFEEYAKALTTNLLNSYKNDAKDVSINLKVVDELALSVETAIPCGLILNELISNALKHAFLEAKAGKIEVTLQRLGENAAKFQIRDNGIGLPVGFQLAKSESLGLRLVNILVTQLHGSLKVNSSLGTDFEITFPLPAGVEVFEKKVVSESSVAGSV